MERSERKIDLLLTPGHERVQAFNSDYRKSVMRRLQAKQFVKPMLSGTKFPALYVGTEGGETLEAVVKLREAVWRQSFSLVVERVAALLARDLGLESAEIVVMDVERTMADDVTVAGFPAYARQIERSPGANVGSLYLGTGFWATLPNEAETIHQRPLLTQIVAFDFLIQNFDRKLANPNILRRGSRIVLIDHEQAFGFIERVEAEPFAVEKLSLEPFLEHIFFHVIDLATDVSFFFEQVALLQPAQIDAYFAGLPPEWLDENSARLRRYLQWVPGNARALRDHFLTLIV